MAIQNRNLAFDWIKGIMILFVVVHHANTMPLVANNDGVLLPFFQHGYIVIDLFFAISGFFLLNHYFKTKDTTNAFLIKRIRGLYLPFVICLTLSVILDYRFFLSFNGFDDFFARLARLYTNYTMTVEIGPTIGPIQLQGTWFIFTLLVASYLLYGIIEYNHRLAIKIILPVTCILGFTFYFSQTTTLDSFERVGAVSLPLVKAFCNMSLGALVYSFKNEEQITTNQRSIQIIGLSALVLFFLIAFTKQSFDALSVVTVPFIILSICSESSWLSIIIKKSWIAKAFCFIGSISLEVLLVHPLVLHIIHSLFKTFRGFFIPSCLLITIDILAVILFSYLLHIFVCYLRRLHKQVKAN